MKAKRLKKSTKQFKFKITTEWLAEKSACSGGVAWFKKQKETDALKVLEKLLKVHWSWFLWLAPRLMTHRQQIKWSIFCAEQVIENFEKLYPKDDRPRKAIQAAKDFLDGKIDANAANAANAEKMRNIYADEAVRILNEEIDENGSNSLTATELIVRRVIQEELRAHRNEINYQNPNL